MASATLDATIQALQNGPKTIPVSAAIQNIDTWTKELGSSSDASVKSVATDLQSLKSLLQAPGGPDDAAITTLLQKLSKSTTAAAGSNSKLQELGTLLAS